MSSLTSTPQWASGQAVEDYLDRFFGARGWQIERTTPHQERKLCLGDRRFSREDRRFYVEYKSGIQTGATGNVFLETISVDTAGVPGWVYTCQADYLFYAALLNGKILIFSPSLLRDEMNDLRRRFREVQTGKGQNKGYNTHGLIVPLGYAEAHLAIKVIEISP